MDINNCHVFRKRICLVIRRNCGYDRICSKFRHSSVYGIYLFEIISNKFYNSILFFFNRYFSSFVLVIFTFQLFSIPWYFSYSKSIRIKMKYIRIIIYYYWIGKEKFFTLLLSITSITFISIKISISFHFVSNFYICIFLANKQFGGDTRIYLINY